MPEPPTTLFFRDVAALALNPLDTQSRRLLEQVSEVLRCKHYSLKTEQACLYRVRFSFAGMGGAEVTQFLTMLANERRASVSTPNLALSALLFLYREVLGQDLPWMVEIGRPVPQRVCN